MERALLSSNLKRKNDSMQKNISIATKHEYI